MFRDVWMSGLCVIVRYLASSRTAAITMLITGRVALFIFCLVCALPRPALAQAGAQDDNVENRAETAGVVDYPAAFFDSYEPDTALDMVVQLPGFQVDNGASERGFAGAAGNILINNRRPSAKQDSPSAILGRIPASLVDRIELIRDQIPGLDLQGQSILANVVLHEDAPAAVRWDATFRKHEIVSPLRTAASISVADSWRSIDYTVGLSGWRAAFGEQGTEQVFAGGGDLFETRDDGSSVINITANTYLNASTWVGNTLLGLNASVGYSDRDEVLESRRTLAAPGGAKRIETFGDYMVNADVELGIDAERRMRPKLVGKAILLFYDRDQDKINDQRIVSDGGLQTLFRVADATTNTTEAISRLEFDWTGWSGHATQGNFEVAFNALENALLRTDDIGDGPELVVVPGANTRVAELRFDILLQDTLSLEPWTFNYGLGAERSTIKQSGDANQERSFSFIKPQFRINWSRSRAQQIRFSLYRDVGQLNFNDFVSATVFLDDDLALGNPDLKPESTWVSNLTYERRFGNLSVASMSVFHHWISDVEDLLPITAEFEAPGNIGDGRRWGAELQMTIPLQALGPGDSRLDIMARWQDSTVVDPVTGIPRVLTADRGFGGVPINPPFPGENEFGYAAEFRQDLQGARFAWGWSVFGRADRPRFKVNELDVFDEKKPVVDLFVESTRWLGIKIGFEINNLLDLTAFRDRTIYVGQRGQSEAQQREVQRYSLGRRYILSLSGSL